MAYVAITAMTLTFRGLKTGKTYVIPITKASAVGYVTFTQDAQTFWFVPEDLRLVDAYLGDSPNAADYLDFYVGGIQKIQERIMLKEVSSATTVPRLAPRSVIRAGSQLALYHYSA